MVNFAILVQQRQPWTILLLLIVHVSTPSYSTSLHISAVEGWLPGPDICQAHARLRVGTTLLALRGGHGDDSADEEASGELAGCSDSFNMQLMHGCECMRCTFAW